MIALKINEVIEVWSSVTLCLSDFHRQQPKDWTEIQGDSDSLSTDILLQALTIQLAISTSALLVKCAINLS